MINYLDFKEAKCKNCYKCLKECPVKSIRIENNQARIISDKCILCGSCTLVCPQNAKYVHSGINKVKQLLNNEKVIASVAPSFISNFNISSFNSLNKALKTLGFVFGEETARGASLVSKKYQELLNKGDYKNLISSCCPSAVRLIELYYPDALKYLAPVDSPIIAHGKLLKQEYPDYKIVFIGPCIAKKRECDESGIIDAVLTFEELDEMFLENNIILEDEEDIDLVSYNKARFYPISRGIIKSFEEYNDKYVYIAVDGIDRCKEVLEEIDILENVFLEINTCRSSCVGGPCRINTNGKAITANSKVRKYVRDNTNKTTLNDLTINIDKQFSKIDINDNIPSEQDIQRILNMTNKYNKEDELNCGACGYDTCRQKAWAIYNGYADINMCLPYMRQRAESLSNEVMKSSPNGIVVIDDEYRIVEINDKAKEYLNIKNVKLGDSTIFEHFSDIDQLVNAIENNSNLNNQLTYINDNKKYLDYSLTLMPEQNLFLMVIKDVTAKTNYDRQLEKIKSDTLALTDDVINKQMKVVQEIASLLGETTAETKAAIYNLKKTFKGDE